MSSHLEPWMEVQSPTWQNSGSSQSWNPSFTTSWQSGFENSSWSTSWPTEDKSSILTGKVDKNSIKKLPLQKIGRSRSLSIENELRESFAGLSMNGNVKTEWQDAKNGWGDIKAPIQKGPPSQTKTKKPLAGDQDQQQQQQQQEQQDESLVGNNIEEELSRQNLYKTELCRSFADTGNCRYGHKCQFAHGEHELRQIMRHPKYKTELCKTFQREGSCRYGNRCRFIHPVSSLPQQMARLRSSSVGTRPQGYSFGPEHETPIWSSSWATPPTVNLSNATKKKSTLPEIQSDFNETDTSGKRLAIFQHIVEK